MFERWKKRRQLRAQAEEVPYWWHSVDLGSGITSPGVKSLADMEAKLAALQLPDVAGKSVLDIGAWDGFFSFAAERLGARRVMALDHYVWSMDLPAQIEHFHRCRAAGEKPPQWETVPEVWRPDELPGKKGFDTAHSALESNVESKVADFMAVDLDEVGSFDVVLYLGVLYHMKNPLAALERVARVTAEVAVIETAAVAIPGFEDRALSEFYESDELNFDPTNWWAPNMKALQGLCRAAGFQKVDAILGPEDNGSGELERYRAVVHAWK